MKRKLNICPTLVFVFVTIFSEVSSQPYKLRLVNMIPANLSSETYSDGELNIAVNPANPRIIAASAFTFSENRQGNCDVFPCDEGNNSTHPHAYLPNCHAPVYFSTDGGETWTLQDVLPSNNGINHDITLSFSESGYLYAAILKGCQIVPVNINNNNTKGFMILRSGTNLNSIQNNEELLPFIKINDLTPVKYDMPWIVAKTDNTTEKNDHVFVGVNNFSKARSENGYNINAQGQSSTILVCNDGFRSAGGSNNFESILVETVPQREKNPAGVRLAAHKSGRVYGLFYRAGTLLPKKVEVERCDVVLVRDDYFAMNTPAFQRLGTGSLIASNQVIPFHMLGSRGYLGKNRLTGADLAIAVNPNNPDHIVAAWCAEDAGAYTLHFKYNNTAGEGEWIPLSENFNAIKHALNPAIAITEDGKIGLLYQQLNADNWWETHFIMGRINKNFSFSFIQDWILSRFPDSEIPVITRNPGLSDYLDLQAVGNTFYGVFAGLNTPDPIVKLNQQKSRFPSIKPIYQRDQSKLLATAPANPEVAASIDPFFFKVEPRQH